MFINNLDLSSLSRKEFLAFIGLILNSFVIDYSYFTEDEIRFINSLLANMIERDS